jgi:biopolymer transport protein ExbD
MLEDFSLDKEFDEEIDLTPMIDVVFILLIFFFVSSAFIRPSLPVNLASAASAAPATERREQQAITIDERGALFCDGVPLSRAELPSRLRARPDVGLNLFVDRAAPFEAFLAVLDEARLQGRDDISITALPVRRE